MQARRQWPSITNMLKNASAAEVVVSVRRRSAGYRHANLLAGAAVAFAGLAAMLFSSHPFRLSTILIDPFVVGLLGGAAVELLPQVKRVLTPRRMRRREVERAARATFVERGIHATRDRSGLLVYISWLEREIVLVPDRGLERALATHRLDEATARLAAAMPRGGAAVAAVLEELAPVLGAAVPRRHDDVNELPDAVDSDLERSRS